MLILKSQNSAAEKSVTDLQRTSAQLEKSLNRLSSGRRIADPSDDAGGLAVGMKLAARIKSIEACKTNVQNAISFLEVQSGALKNMASIVTRIDELRVMSDDVTKSPTDIQNYQTEYSQLRLEMLRLAQQDFNGISLFGKNLVSEWTAEERSSFNSPLTVYLSEDGAQTMKISRPILFDLPVLEHKVAPDSAYAKFFPVGEVGSDGKLKWDGDGKLDLIHDVEFLTDISHDALSVQLALVAEMIATNGAESSRLKFALDSLSVNGVNIEAAHGRIMDVDLAHESGNLARIKILHEAGMSSLQKANDAMKYILPLLSPGSSERA